MTARIVKAGSVKVAPHMDEEHQSNVKHRIYYIHDGKMIGLKRQKEIASKYPDGTTIEFRLAEHGKKALVRKGREPLDKDPRVHHADGEVKRVRATNNKKPPAKNKTGRR